MSNRRIPLAVVQARISPSTHAALEVLAVHCQSNVSAELRHAAELWVSIGGAPGLETLAMLAHFAPDNVGDLQLLTGTVRDAAAGEQVGADLVTWQKRYDASIELDMFEHLETGGGFPPPSRTNSAAPRDPKELIV